MDSSGCERPWTIRLGPNSGLISSIAELSYVERNISSEKSLFGQSQVLR